MEPLEPLDRLMEGNRRYVEGKPKAKDLNAKRKETVSGQRPFVTIVSCSDSRVVPEYIFDASIGELFIVRVAGNVLDSCSLGSVEYGIAHLHTPLLIILGHEKCGAVTAACNKVCEKNNIDFIIEKIQPAICNVGTENVEYTIEENIRCARLYIENASNVIKEKIKEGKVKIVGMKYSLTTGKVELVR